MSSGHAARRPVTGGEEGFQVLRGGLAAVFFPKALEVFLGLGVNEAVEIFLTRIGVGERVGAGAMGHVEVDDFAHDANEGEVDGMVEGVAHGEESRVVSEVEVAEGMLAAAGEEDFGGTGITAVHSGFQKAGQRPVRPVGFHDPGTERISSGDFLTGFQLLVKLGDDFQVGGQRAEFGRGAEFQARGLAHVERLIVVVHLEPQLVHGAGVFVQGKRVEHAGFLARRQHAGTGQAGLHGGAGLGELLQALADGLRGGAVQRGVDGEVHAIELVGGFQAEEGDQFAADGIDALALRVDDGLARGRRLAEFAFGRQSFVAEFGGDHALSGHHF